MFNVWWCLAWWMSSNGHPCEGNHVKNAITTHHNLDSPDIQRRSTHTCLWCSLSRLQHAWNVELVCVMCVCVYVCVCMCVRVLKIPACAFLCNNLWVGTLKKRCTRFRLLFGSGWLVDTRTGHWQSWLQRNDYFFSSSFSDLSLSGLSCVCCTPITWKSSCRSPPLWNYL